MLDAGLWKNLFRFLAIAGILSLAACSGDTDGGPAGDQTFDGTSFTSDESNSGGLRLIVDSNDLDVAATTSFRVEVFDASGAAVPQVEIACDTEEGLALIEPNSGYELTDSYGSMSGVVGCELPGSFQMACRLPIGSQRRKFETIRCNGPIPAGFTGFDGAGGGTLGTGGDTTSGGVDTGQDAGTGGGDITGVRISSIAAHDDGGDFTDASSGTSAIDVVQGLCGEDPDFTPEPFFDTHMAFRVVNNSNRNITFNAFSYSISDSDGAGTPFNSRKLALLLSGEVEPNGKSVDVAALFARASGGQKFFTGSSSAIPSSLGFRNVTVRLYGQTSTGEEVTISGRTGLSFGAYSRCD